MEESGREVEERRERGNEFALVSREDFLEMTGEKIVL